MTEFHKQDKTYICRVYDSVVYRTEDLAFLYDPVCGTLLKHGDITAVLSIFQIYRQQLEKYSYNEISLMVLSQSNWELETINRFLQCTGSIQSWHKSNLNKLNDKTRFFTTTFNYKI